MRLFDSHCHVDSPQFDADRDEMLARAKAAGVSHIITIGASDELHSAHRALALSEQHSFLFPTAGVHPHSASLPRERASELESLASNTKVVGIGETGLDYHYDFAPRAEQQWWFEYHLDLAEKYQKPVVIHCRNAAPDILATIKRFPKATGVFHCFTESQAVADEALSLGWYISAAGIATFKNTESLRAAIATVPLDRLLIETDAPFLAPVPFRGKRNEAAYVSATAHCIAQVKQCSVEELAATTFNNTVRLFQLEGRI